MNKQVWCLLLCVAMLISIVPISATADELIFYQVMIDVGNGTQREKAIIEDGEIYIAASSYEKYTRYEYNEDMPGFLVKGQEENKAFKKVLVNAETKKAVVGTKLIELSNSFVVDGEAYLPFCQMLPILNADIINVDSGVIYVINNELSMAELLYDFDINEYWFNISEEFFDRTDLLYWYVAPSYLFDTVVNFRFDRLDFIFDSGKSQDYQTILTGYLKDDELFHKVKSENDTADDLLESITGLTGISKTFNDVYDWAEKINKLKIEEDLQEYFEFDELELFIKKGYAEGAFDDELEDILGLVHDDMISNDILQDAIPGGLSFADALDAVDYLYSLLTQVDDHRKMLDAVYGIVDRSETTDIVAGSSSLWFAYDVQHIAAAQVYDVYSGDIIPAYKKKMTEEIVKRLFEDRTLYNAYGVYKLTADLAGSIFELYLPGDSGDRALLPQHADIANSAMEKAAVPTLDTEASTDKYRLSLLLTLIASRACYDIMAETASGYGQDDGYYRRKIDDIENMIMGLYLVAGNVAFDTYENYEAFAEQNRQILKDAGMFEDILPYPEVDESDYLAFLNDHPEYNYYSLLDINGDGVLELLAAYEVNDDFNPVGDVDIFIYRDGEICLGLSDVWAKYDALLFDKDNHWVAQHHGGSSGYGMTFYYIDQLLCFQEMSFDTRCERVDEYGNEVWDKYYNWEKITSDNTQDYDNLVEAWTNSNPENIVFQALPKAALIGEWNLYCGGVPHENGYWQEVWVSNLNLKSDGTVEAMMAVAQSEIYTWYTGHWTVDVLSNTEFFLRLDVTGGPFTYAYEESFEEDHYSLQLKARLNEDHLTFELISGDNICLYYGADYERNLEFETWEKRRGSITGPITFEKLLQLYPDTAEYTVYDINKDGVDELIIHDNSTNYLIFAYTGSNVILCSEWILTPCSFYTYEGNGMIIRSSNDVGVYEFTGRFLEPSYDYFDVESFMSDIDSYSEIDNFHPVTDKSLLTK